MTKLPQAKVLWQEVGVSQLYDLFSLKYIIIKI